MKLNWGNSIVLIFIIFISLAITFIVFSLQQRNDLVTEDYYEKGAAYTQQMEIMERSLIYTDSVSVNQENGYVSVILSKGLSAEIDSLELCFYYAANKEKDYLVGYSGEIGDTLSIPASKLSKGRYTLKLSWVIDSAGYYLEKGLYIR